jgi:hypothetical protein
VSTLYNGEQLLLRDSFEAAFRKAGSWYEMAVSLLDVSPEVEERPLLENVTKQRSEDRD